MSDDHHDRKDHEEKERYEKKDHDDEDMEKASRRRKRMSGYYKNGLFFAAGAALGALGIMALGRKGSGFRQALTTVLAGGIEVKERAMTVLEQARENIEDMVAEAAHIREQHAGGQPADQPADQPAGKPRGKPIDRKGKQPSGEAAKGA